MDARDGSDASNGIDGSDEIHGKGHGRFEWHVPPSSKGVLFATLIAGLRTMFRRGG
jgi:hypothetical protein